MRPIVVHKRLELNWNNELLRRIIGHGTCALSVVSNAYTSLATAERSVRTFAIGFLAGCFVIGALAPTPQSIRRETIVVGTDLTLGMGKKFVLVELQKFRTDDESVQLNESLNASPPK